MTRTLLVRKAVALCAAGALTATVISASVAQESSRPSGAEAHTPLSGVTVTAPRRSLQDKRTEEHRVRDFVQAMSIVSRNDQIPKITRKVCPRVAGLKGDQNRLVLERVVVAAGVGGMVLDKPDCIPDVDILFTSDPEGLIRALDRYGYAFFARNEYVSGDAGATGGDPGGGVRVFPGSSTPSFVDVEPSRFRDFLKDQSPIKWWQTISTQRDNGRGGSTSDSHEALGRIRSQTHDEIVLSLVIIDLRRIEGLSLLPVANYVAMAALVGPNKARLPVRKPTVLNLFSDLADGKPLEADFTAWDRAYLQALKDMPLDRSRYTQATALEQGVAAVVSPNP